MEHQTGFDLTAAIERWRQELAGQANLTVEERRELETHLRDAVTELQSLGLSQEESFWLARRRVGQPQALGEEFAKDNPSTLWRERLLWIALALLGFSLWETLFYTLRNAVPWTINRNGQYPLHTMLIQEIVHFAPVILLGVCAARGRVAGGAISRFLFQSRLRFGFCASVLVLLICWLSIRDLGELSLLLWASSVTWPLTLVAAITWLMPVEGAAVNHLHPQPAEDFAEPDRIWRERVLWAALGLLGLNLWGTLMQSFSFAVTGNPITGYKIFVRTVLYLAPVIGLGVCAAHGRPAGRALWLHLFHSRLRFGLAASAAVLLDYGLPLGIPFLHGWQGMPVRDLSWFPGILLCGFIWPLILVAAIMWLMPDGGSLDKHQYT